MNINWFSIAKIVYYKVFIVQININVLEYIAVLMFLIIVRIHMHYI